MHRSFALTLVLALAGAAGPGALAGQPAAPTDGRAVLRRMHDA